MPTLNKDEAEAFIYREARLLDEWSLDQWRDLFAEDGLYWLPMTDDGEPYTSPSILCDDAQQRAFRVHQLTRHDHLSQTPHSRTVHIISNVELLDDGANGEAKINCNMLIFELRPGDFQALRDDLGRQRAMAARCRFRLRHDGEWKILEKRVSLLDRDLPLYNLTFIL